VLPEAQNNPRGAVKKNVNTVSTAAALKGNSALADSRKKTGYDFGEFKSLWEGKWEITKYANGDTYHLLKILYMKGRKASLKERREGGGYESECRPKGKNLSRQSLAAKVCHGQVIPRTSWTQRRGKRW